MKKLIIGLGFLFCVFTVSAQRNNTTTTVENNGERLMLHATACFGQTYFGNNFFINTFGADYSKQLDNKTTLYLGANIFNINTSKTLIDRAPRNKHTGATYIGLSYQASKNLTVYGDVFYNGIYNMIGADLDLKYNFSETCFLEISATFVRQLNPSGYHQTISYGNDYIFHPFIFGY